MVRTYIRLDYFYCFQHCWKPCPYPGLLILMGLTRVCPLRNISSPLCGSQDLLVGKDGLESSLSANGHVLNKETVRECACTRQNEHCICSGNGLAMSALYPEMRFSWEIKSVDALFCNGLTRFGDLSKEGILQAIKDGDLRFLQVRALVLWYFYTLYTILYFYRLAPWVCVHNIHNE